MNIIELEKAVSAPDAKLPGSPARAIAEFYGVDIYHLRHLCWASKFLKPQGKRILEIGGRLPPRLIEDFLQPEQWVSVEYVPYYQELNATLPRDLVPMSPRLDPECLGQFEAVSGAAEDIPESWAGCFDGIFSVACFEHVNRLPEALTRMYACLKSKSGRLYSGFSPTWSSATGYHWSGSFPEESNNANIGELVGPWGHLLYGPAKLWSLLAPVIGERNASEFCYYTYHSNHINRYFVNDYLNAVKATKFEGKIIPYAHRDLPSQIKNILNEKYPLEKDFSADGLVFNLTKH